MDNRELDQLVQRAQEGDRDAMNDLLIACEPAMRRLAGRVCPPAEADDAIQEVLFRVSEHVGALRVTQAFISWGMKMLVRQCLDYKRRAARLVFGEPESSVNPRDVRTDLARAFVQLSEPSREILLHRDVLERTGPETAQLLGISLESAKSRLRRARGEMRLILE